MSPSSVDRGHDARYAALLVLADLPASGGVLPEVAIRFAAGVALVVAFDECLVLVSSADGEPPQALVVRAATEPAAASTVDLAGLDIRAFGLLTGPRIVEDVATSDAIFGLRDLLRGRGLRSACLVPLGAPARPAGVICLAADRPAAFAGADVDFLRRAASLLALAIEREDSRRTVGHHRTVAAVGEDHWRALLELNNALVGTLDLDRLRATIAGALKRFISFEFISLLLFDEDGGRVALLSLDPDVPGGVRDVMATIRVDDVPFAGPDGLPGAVVCDPGEMTFLPEGIRSEEHFRSMRRFCLLPLVTARRMLGALSLSSRHGNAFPPDEVARAAQAAGQIAIAVENALAFQEIAALKDRLAEEKLYLEDEIRGWNDFEEIVGESAALKRVLTQLRNVADTDTTVLLLGETGTGKELFARAIHSLSPRRSRTLVAVNCAASPENLLESEWFGYEKGAFTGALARKLGRFELADKGTLFLDEIGDVPMHLQAKLLRVLQEREVERLGATRPMPVDFRLIAATNADLQSLVTEKKFRSDLYYRLNVFPIRIPPLRERPEDIPPLVACFTRRYAARLRRPIDSVPRETMDALCRWPWPGNVRELQNVIERAVILSPGRALQVPAADFAFPGVVAGTLEAAEREHILKALLDADWVVGGPTGAAARLGLKRTTLISTMKRLGIERPSRD